MWNKHWPVSELLYHTGSSCRTYRGTLVLLIHLSRRCMVTLLSVPDITQVNLACIPKACLLVCAKTLSTLALSDRVASLTLCCQPASYITSSPSLGHVTPLTGDGCLPPKDSWVMALILISRRGTIACHSQSVCCKREQMQRERGSGGVPSDKAVCATASYAERIQYGILNASVPVFLLMSCWFM